MTSRKIIKQRTGNREKDNSLYYVLLLGSCLLVLSPAVYGQSKGQKGSPVVIVTGKPMTSVDSAMVKQLFFSALREKTIENFTLSSEFFERVLQIDPANDASMFELANMERVKNNYDDARQLLEKAVTVNPDNEWYWTSLADCYEKTNDLGKLENVFNELTRIKPDKTSYYLDKANVYFLEKKYDDALRVYDQLEKITGPDDDLLATDRRYI